MLTNLSKSIFSSNNLTFFSTLTILFLILFLRVTRGLDLTDEMQYYGEIQGLLETGRLFNNDLFIQQLVYILFYPILKIYHLFFGMEGMVFFSRLVLAVMSVGIFIYAYQKLMSNSLPEFTSSLTALTLTFAIPYHGLFNLSYNTVSQVAWIIFTLNFLQWERKNLFLFGSVFIVTILAHPPSALMMGALLFLRLTYDGSLKEIRTMFYFFSVAGLMLAFIAINVATPQEYLRALSFSSGYGTGTRFLASGIMQVFLVGFFTLIGSCWLASKYLNIGTYSQSSNTPLIIVTFIALGIPLSVLGFFGGAYTASVVVFYTLLSTSTYLFALFNITSIDLKRRETLHWTIILLLGYVTILGITSGNGMTQATGAFMVILPLLVTNTFFSGVKEAPGTHEMSKLGTYSIILLCILYTIQWSNYPYRDSKWWNSNQPIKSVSDFKYINTSSERLGFINQMQELLLTHTSGRKVLIVSEYPGLYPILEAHPETCMLYMHSLTTIKSENALKNCLQNKSPEMVIDIITDKDIAKNDSRIKQVMQDFYRRQEFECTNKSLDISMNPGPNNIFNISICQKF